jgi:predicted nuclease of predicted toxin-antitoxin system
MKILLDENLDWRLERFLPGHNVHSVTRIGWAGIKNGILLQQAVSDGCDVLVTMDSALSTQQNIASLPIAVVALRAPSNRLADTSPLMPRLLALLSSLPQGQVTVIDA